jgi:hypothetical protein
MRARSHPAPAPRRPAPARGNPAPAARRPAPAGDGLVAALRAEWLKLRTVPGSVVALTGIVALTVLVTAFMCGVGHTDAVLPGQGDDDVVVNSLRGVYLGQLAVIGFAVTAATAEYDTGLSRATLVAMPRRHLAVLAQAVIVTAAVLVAGFVAAVASFLVGQPLLHEGGYAPPAYPIVTLTDPTSVRAVAGTAVFLAALASLGVAVGLIVRRAAPAVAILGGLLLTPLVLGGFPLPEAVERILRAGTPLAGLAVQSTPGMGDPWPVGPWAGLAVTCAWAVAGLLVAMSVVGRRDA